MSSDLPSLSKQKIFSKFSIYAGLWHFQKSFDNNLITAHRIGWIIWTHQIIKKMRYQIYEAKSVKHDAQQRVGVMTKNAGSRINTGFFLNLSLFLSSALGQPGPDHLR